MKKFGVILATTMLTAGAFYAVGLYHYAHRQRLPEMWVDGAGYFRLEPHGDCVDYYYSQLADGLNFRYVGKACAGQRFSVAVIGDTVETVDVRTKTHDLKGADR